MDDARREMAGKERQRAAGSSGDCLTHCDSVCHCHRLLRAVVLFVCAVLSLALCAAHVSAAPKAGTSTSVQGATLQFSVLSTATKAKAEEPAALSFPQAAPALAPKNGAPLSLDASNTLLLRLRVTARPRPLAVFLRVSGGASSSSSDALFVLRPTSDDDALYVLRLALGSSEVLESLGGAAGGAFDLTLLVSGGAGSAERLTEWKLGSAALALPASSAANSQAALDAYFSARPLIAHTFRSAETRAPFVVSALFTVAVAAPFVALLLALSRSGLRLSLPSNPSELLYAFVFQGAIAAILLSYVLYWLSLNIFQELALLAAVGTVAVFAGTAALRLLHQRSGVKGHAE